MNYKQNFKKHIQFSHLLEFPQKKYEGSVLSDKEINICAFIITE